MGFVSFWIVIIAAIIAVSSSILGTILVLRKDSMLADALSHSVLPGIALAFFITQSRASVAMVIGAVVMALLTSFISNYLSETIGLERNSALGVVFTGFFAIGIMLITFGARAVDLDPSCVLFGAIELTPLNTLSAGGINIPIAAVSNGFMLLVNLCFTGLFLRQLNVITFNSSFAKVRGLRVELLRYVHILLVAITCVTAFESVGSIMIIAFLVIPPAVAWLFARSIKQMLLYSSIIAIIAVLLSELVQRMFEGFGLSFVGIISAVLGLLFTVSIFFSSQGKFFRSIRSIRVRLKTTQEDILKTLQLSSVSTEEFFHGATIQHTKKHSLGSKFLLWCSLKLLQKQQFILVKAGVVSIRNQGLVMAKELSRKHRLWEEFLYSKGAFSSYDVHYSAEILEHINAQDITTELNKETDPDVHIPGHKH